MIDDPVEKGYTWETEYERTWEALTEDATGSLQASINAVIHRAKRQRLLDRPLNVRLGMMRHMFIVLDCSQAMQEQDLKPTRLVSSLTLLQQFVEQYFDQNPISQLGLIITRSKRAEKKAELAGNPRRHVSLMKSLLKEIGEGEASLQNSLEVAADMLKHMPSHASREILIIYGSLSTCDPGDIQQTIKLLQRYSIRCSIIGLAAEVRICKRLCKETGGKYNVIADESHFKDLLQQQVTPPVSNHNTQSCLIKMGFPHHELPGIGGMPDRLSLCLCHPTGGGSDQGYFCPQCSSKVCELPAECKACGITLVSAPHLARSYHHLFPIEPFEELPSADIINPHLRVCFACQKFVSDATIQRCSHCQKHFCIDCDIFIHDVLHACPGCSASQHATFK